MNVLLCFWFCCIHIIGNSLVHPINSAWFNSFRINIIRILYSLVQNPSFIFITIRVDLYIFNGNSYQVPSLTWAFLWLNRALSFENVSNDDNENKTKNLWKNVAKKARIIFRDKFQVKLEEKQLDKRKYHCFIAFSWTLSYRISVERSMKLLRWIYMVKWNSMKVYYPLLYRFVNTKCAYRIFDAKYLQQKFFQC